MRIIAKRTLRLFWEKHPDSEAALRAWHAEVSKADWSNPADIKVRFPSASFLVGNRVVFNIKGNHYRIVVRINFPYRVVYLRFVGTHAEYDSVDATTV